MTNRKLEERRARAKKINKKLKKLFPDAEIELKYKNPLQLLIAVILSAQATDKKVNEITGELFKKYKTLDDYVNARPVEFEKDIHQSGFFRSKTKNILGATKKIKEDYGGEVPKTMDEILTLPGVARKTANIVLRNAYGVIEGIAVDTHVARLSQKLDLTDNKDPVKIEQDLMKIIPKRDWGDFNHRLVLYGRYICIRRHHRDCGEHPLSQIYPKARHKWP